MRLPGNLLAQYATLSVPRAYLDLCATWGGIVVAAAAAHVAGHWLAYAAAIVVIAALQNRLIVLAHECWHRKCFAPVRLNQALGAWAYSYPVGTPYRADQKRHLAHHKLVGDPSDPDWSDYARPGFAQTAGVLGYLASQLLGAKLVLRVVGLASARFTPPKAAQGEAGFGDELPRIAGAQLALLGLFAIFGHWWEYLLLWVLPLISIASFLVSYRALLEHVSLEPDSRPEDRLFDFAAGHIERFFLSPCLFHLHALHHAYPAVPYYHKRALLQALDARGVAYTTRWRGSYWQTLHETLHAEGGAPAQSGSA